jgi:hypothetical protein
MQEALGANRAGAELRERETRAKRKWKWPVIVPVWAAAVSCVLSRLVGRSSAANVGRVRLGALRCNSNVWIPPQSVAV